MKVAFKSMKLVNFKNHDELELEFNNLVKITGRNGAGKSSVAEAITWLLYGVDMMGVKLDPTPIYKGPVLKEVTETPPTVELVLHVTNDEGAEEITLKKELKKEAKYFVDGTPEKATFFNEKVASLFDKNLFLSIFSPSYFFSQKPKEQREQILQYVKEPLQKDVLAAMEMPEKDKESLQEHLKKKDVERLIRHYKPIHDDAKAEVERLGERRRTLEEQLKNQDLPEIDEEEIKKEMDKLKKEIDGIELINNNIMQQEQERYKVKMELDQAHKKINTIKENVYKLMEKQINDSCYSCGQPLKGEALERAKETHEAEIEAEKAKGKEWLIKYRELQAKMEEPEPREKLNARDLSNKLYEKQAIIDNQERAASLENQIKKAAANKEAKRAEMLEALTILEGAKKYGETKNKLMVKNVSSLFDKLSVKLFELQKNGVNKETFEIEYMEKPYSKLSTAERIKAGLELIEALIDQSGVSIPVFIDNAESVITFKQPSAQLFTATVKNSALIVKGENE